MPGPDNCVYIVVGEMNMVVTAMRRGSRWSSHSHQEEEQDSLLRNFSNLKEILNHIGDLSDLEPAEYLTPFLDVIRSENTTGPVTGFALSAINKFLSYGLIDKNCVSASAAIENIADAVTHARFVGTDPASDEVVLMKILQVLRSLLLTNVGSLLSNESVCEIMQSCFRICFEMRLSELLRKSAEHSVMDMVQLLFSRLPQFTEDPRWTSMKKLKMRASGIDTSRSHRKRRSPRAKRKKVPTQISPKKEEFNIPTPPQSNIASPNVPPLDSSVFPLEEQNNDTAETQVLPDNVPEVASTFLSDTQIELDSPSHDPDGQTTIMLCQDPSDLSSFESSFTQQHYSMDPADDMRSEIESNSCGTNLEVPDIMGNPDIVDISSERSSFIGDSIEDTESVISGNEVSVLREGEYINPRGVRFTTQHSSKDGSGPLVPYGLPCVRELFRFLVSLVNPLDRNNTEVMIQIGLSLLTVALEAGADHMGNFSSLLSLIKDETCRNLFSLLSTDRLTIFAAALRVCFLLFESLRTHLKFQLEMFLTRLMEIIISESPRIPYEQREIALDCIAQMWRIPGLVTELYLNYDCDLYCSNLYDDLTKLLSKNAFPVSGLYSTHLLSLDALLAVIDSIETHCHYRILNESQMMKEGESKQNAELTSDDISKSSSEIRIGASGYLLGQQLLKEEPRNVAMLSSTGRQDRKTPQIRPNRQKVSANMPTHEELMAIKHKKKLLITGTEHFNTQPSKGIAFLQEHGILQDPLDPQEVALFLRDNPQLDKRMIGEYVSNRKNLKSLEAFVRSFTFEDTRIDEALRQYLETFRLPGEAPLISLLLEHFSEHWHKSTGEPFANSDAAFTLAYAVIMLNVDQHNYNVKRQNIPMTVEDFKKNLKAVNGGQDFDEEMLEEIYTSIKSEEIVMPAEQTGLVRENYLWKVLLRRGINKEGNFTHAPNGLFDHDLFSVIWGPTVAALSFVFDKSLDPTITQKAISGFRKCAMISAHYGMSDVFDNLVISLCKFTTLLSSESPEALPISFGSNTKAHMAAKAVFNLAHRHGDILREGWKNLLDCVLQLYRAKLLPKEMVEVEDFVNSNGFISLIREDLPIIPRTESGILSSFYSYITLTADSQIQRGPNPEDEAARQTAVDCVQDCHPEQLITESKFLRIDSLQELVKTLIFACQGPDSPSSLGSCYDEDSTVFLLEILIKIVLQNRDRVTTIWPGIRDHLYSLVMGAGASDHHFLLERGIVGVLRIAIRLIRREEMIPQVLQSLRMLLLLKPSTLLCVSRQVSCALHELLRTNAANIHMSQDWNTIFTLIECVGAGAKPPCLLNGSSDGQDSAVDSGAQSDSEVSISHQPKNSSYCSDRGYTSDSELYESQGNGGSPKHITSPHHSQESVGSNGGWLLVNKKGEIETVQMRPLAINQYNIIFHRELLPHDPLAFLKCCESLVFLVRDVAHITPENFECCVRTIRTFVEASINGGQVPDKKLKIKTIKEKRGLKSLRKKDDFTKSKKSHSGLIHSGEPYDADDEDRNEELSPAYQQVSMQLLDLMHTLHTRAASVWQPSSEDKDNLNEEESSLDGSLWTKCWCPLLQGIARLCCDQRRVIRTSALTFLQRALLVHDLQALTPVEWEACFNKVLFPLLSKLLENININDPMGMEETRMRGATLLCKVFLQHLSPLLTLPTFTALWLTILDFMDKYMHSDGSDLLNEAIPESLKNMLLVMDTAGIFTRPEGSCSDVQNHLWNITWDRIAAFLPHLKEEVFKPTPKPSPSVPVAEEQAEVISETKSENSSQSVQTGSGEQSEAIKETEVAKVSSVPMSSSPFTTSSDITTHSVILHPPAFHLGHPAQQLSRIPPSGGISNPVVSLPLSSTSVPLLLNPSVMSQAHMPIFTTQSSHTKTSSGS